MDYDILNSAVEDIVYIVNQYNKDQGYDVSLCEKLVLVLLGYYMAFGPELFKKIDTVLSALEIHQCKDQRELVKLKENLCPYATNVDSNPGMIWKHVYDSSNKFIGSIPIIFFHKEGLISDVFSLGHELSHALEGTSAQVIEETATELKLKHGMGTYLVDKETNRYKSDGHGMTELITIAIENKILREYLKLDPQQITNPIVKKFVGQLSTYQNNNVLLNSYGIMSGLFKDLIDSEVFFDMIKRNYYDNQQEALIEEFDSIDSRLSLRRLRQYADKVSDGEYSEAMYYAGPIQKQLDVLNKKTGITPDKRILLVI